MELSEKKRRKHIFKFVLGQLEYRGMFFVMHKCGVFFIRDFMIVFEVCISLFSFHFKHRVISVATIERLFVAVMTCAFFLDHIKNKLLLIRQEL